MLKETFNFRASKYLNQNFWEKFHVKYKIGEIIKLRSYFNSSDSIKSVHNEYPPRNTSCWFFCSECGDELFREKLTLNAGELFMMNLGEKSPWGSVKG